MELTMEYSEVIPWSTLFLKRLCFDRVRLWIYDYVGFEGYMALNLQYGCLVVVGHKLHFMHSLKLACSWTVRGLKFKIFKKYRIICYPYTLTYLTLWKWSWWITVYYTLLFDNKGQVTKTFRTRSAKWFLYNIQSWWMKWIANDNFLILTIICML